MTTTELKTTPFVWCWPGLLAVFTCSGGQLFFLLFLQELSPPFFQLAAAPGFQANRVPKRNLVKNNNLANQETHSDQFWVNALTYGNPFSGTKLLGFSVETGVGALKGLGRLVIQKMIGPKNGIP